MQNTNKLNLVKEFFYHLDFQHLIRDLEIDWEFYKEQIYNIVKKSESVDKAILEMRLLKSQNDKQHLEIPAEKAENLSSKYHALREQIRD